MSGSIKDMLLPATVLALMGDRPPSPVYAPQPYKSGLTLKQQAKRKTRNKMARHSRKMNRGL